MERLDPVIVTRLEGDLVKLARMLATGGGVPAQAVLYRKSTVPGGISPNAARLVEDAIRKGLLRLLVASGGWRTRRFFANGQAEGGHPWRRQALHLRFSRQVLSFLVWLASERPGEAREVWKASSPLTVADHLFFLSAAEALIPFPDVWAVLARSTPFAANPLLRLAMPRHCESDGEADYRLLFEPTGTAILECLQDWLAERWQQADEAKATANLTRIDSDNRRESEAIAAFLNQAAEAKRPDLGLFFLRAIRERMKKPFTDYLWLSGIQRLADRQRLSRESLSLFQSLDHFDRWNRQARSIGYFDDGYAAAQFLLGEFEELQFEMHNEKYRARLRELDPLSTG